MATRARSTALVVRSSSPAPARRSNGAGLRALQKYQKRMSALASRARNVSTETESAILTVGVPAALGLLQARGTQLPTIGGFDPYLVWGLPAALFGRKMAAGKTGARITAAGLGMLAVAANRAGATGTVKVAGDEIGADDDEVGADDDDF